MADGIIIENYELKPGREHITGSEILIYHILD